MNTRTADELWGLIRTGRSAKADWLDETASLESIASSITAMANTHGGTFLLGIISPPGSAPVSTSHIVGVDDAEGVIDRVLQAALSIDPPLIIPMPRAVQLSGKTVIAVSIPPGMPHVYSLDGRYLRRENVNNVALNPREMRRLIIERGEASFETEFTRGAGMDDIDWDKARAYVTGLGSESDVQKVLVKRGCLTYQDGMLRPTNAGILLFGKDPQRHIRGSDITAVRFAGESMSDTFSRQDIAGSLPDQIRRAETFLVDHLRKSVQMGRRMARDESFEYPMEAARELLVNAVAHRDYSISGDGIRLFIFSNRMEVISPGGLAGPVTVANIRDERFSRNPAIVQVLADMGFIERLGYGVDRVIELMQRQMLRDPEFEETGGGFRVVLHRRPEDARKQEVAEKTVVQFNGEYEGTAINPRQEAALVYLHNDSNPRITNSDLQALCPDVHPETIRRDLADLVTKNILKKLGQKRGSYYVLSKRS